MLSVIGIGAGDPEWVTVAAIGALNRLDVVFSLDKGPAAADLAALRREVCERYTGTDAHRTVALPDAPRVLPDPGAPGYDTAVAAWHDERRALYRQLVFDELADGECGGFLVWGDPAVYDSTVRLVAEIAEGGGVDYDVVPGISAAAALAARHRIVLNQVGGAVLTTTGRRLAAGWPDGVDDVVVMLDGTGAFVALAGRDEPWIDDVHLYWGAYLGTPDEILVEGPLRRCAGEVAAVRARARERKGWMFDTYLLRRPAP